MRITKQFVLIMAFIVALACGYAAAVEGEDLGKGGGATTGPASKGAPAGGAASQPASQQRTTQQQGLFDGPMIYIMLGGVFLLFIFSSRSKRKQATKRKDMLAALQKGAKVTTIGGILGSVVEVRDDEVTIKIGEAGNTRLRVARWAIRGVGEEGKGESGDQKR